MSADQRSSKSGSTALTVVAILAVVGGGCSSRSENPAVIPNDGKWQFTDVTAAAGLASFRHETGAIGEFWIPESIGSGAAFIEMDGDGWIDIVVVRGGYLTDTTADGSAVPELPALAAYRNQGDGTYLDVTADVGLDRIVAYGQGLQVADYDGDGDDDLFLTTLGRNVLLRNDGGRFTDVSEESGLDHVDEWSTAAAFFDADGDGDLDLYVGNYVDWSIDADVFCSLDGVSKTYCTPKAYQGTPGRFYRNEGNGHFTDRTAEAGFGGSPGNTLGVVAFDYDHDGLIDVYVSNDLRQNLLYRNNGDGTFTEVALYTGAAYDERGHARAGMGVDAGIVDSSGMPTIFVGNFSNEPLDAFQYTSENVFLSRESAMRLLRPSLSTLTFGLFLFDADLDGYLDLLAVNGHVQPDIEKSDPNLTYRQPIQLFRNLGDGTFRDVAPELGEPLARPLAGRGGAYADFDGDGDLDLLITENGGSVYLLRNDLPQAGKSSGRSVRVALRASTSAPGAVGARLAGYVDGRAIEQQRRSGASYLSASEAVITFGIGQSRGLDSLVVYWPSGIRSVHPAISAGEIATIDEPSR